MKRSRECVGALVVGLLLAGCGGGEAAGRAPTGPSAGSGSHRPTSPRSATSAEPSSSSTPPAGAVVVPPAAQAHTPEGAKAFADFYLHQYSLAAQRGEPALMDGLALPRCQGCSALRGVVLRLQRDDEHVDIDAMRVHLAQEMAGSAGNSVIVDLLAEELPKRIVAKDGTTVANVRGEKFDFRFRVDWLAQAWSVADLRLVR